MQIKIAKTYTSAPQKKIERRWKTDEIFAPTRVYFYTVGKPSSIVVTILRLPIIIQSLKESYIVGCTELPNSRNRGRKTTEKRNQKQGKRR